MSVPAPKRNENKLQALKDSEEAVAYIIQMCMNEQCFPKKHRWALANKLIDAGLDLLLHIRTANKVKPKDEKQFRYRLDQSWMAVLDIEKIWALLKLSEKTLNIPIHKLEVCSDLLYKAETIVYKWRKSDLEKYKKECS